jgi:3-oxoacyl-(acyl-carrier-protein) synthase
MNAPTSTVSTSKTTADAQASAAATTSAPAAPGDIAGVGVVAAVASHELPADAGELKAAAKAAGAPRQVVRFLDGMALPAFVAGMTALDAAGVTEPADGERCGLFTISGWDPDQHQPELGPDQGDQPATYETVARHYITTASPMAWLRKMVNNVLCQLSLSRNLRGPNNHVVGGPGALAAVLALGGRSIETGGADRVLVLAYDAPLGHESDHDVAGQAAAVVLGPAQPGRSALPAPATRDIGSRGDGPANGHGGRAVDALDALIAEHGRA